MGGSMESRGLKDVGCIVSRGEAHLFVRDRGEKIREQALGAGPAAWCMRLSSQSHGVLGAVLPSVRRHAVNLYIWLQRNIGILHHTPCINHHASMHMRRVTFGSARTEWSARVILHHRPGITPPTVGGPSDSTSVCTDAPDFLPSEGEPPRTVTQGCT